MKVDWTPELHRRFVQAVEQLGVEKAVPSRILELMGIDCLTRHNIASHLQRVRRRRQAGVKDDKCMELPPRLAEPPMHMWPKQLAHSPSPLPPPPPTWHHPPPGPPYWHHHAHQRVPNVISPGTPCFPPPLAARFHAPPVTGIPPPHAMYKVDPGAGAVAGRHNSGPSPFLDFHPSNESVDAAIGDVLSKPWLPLPLGLKPPATDSVLVALQNQGVAKIPPP
ncbi:hypothetical protein OIU85_007084 [Salix viminalis]|uniref:HTH myb-type domain-containing protein n=1 Tax=Salix viminalis TaxID=40686 RepID=A0A9Q0SNJ0_SALVM|nr:hypothetical protein OIU85_007084 [Salix viminalis]